MNIKETYWKYKRAFRKRREMISRIISTTLTVALIAGVAYLGYNIYQSDLEREALANQEVDKTEIKKNSKKNYGTPGFNKVAENANMILAADYTTGEIRITEKATGKEWFSNPQDRSEDKIANVKTKLNAQFFVKFVNAGNGIKDEANNYFDSIKNGLMEHELIDNGIKFTFGFPVANVYIPVQYTLTEDGFMAEIVTSEIVGVGGNPFLVESIDLLPYFGAGGLEDEGYLFVPDGSGALIDYNKYSSRKQGVQKYTGMVYGNNPTLTLEEQQPVRESISLPVFGAKCNDSAFLGVITNGEAYSSISAYTSQIENSYNYVYPTAILREYDLVYNKGNSQALISSHTIDYSEDLMNGENYAVRYFFLNGDDANYTGMSNCYRQYLIDNGMLKDSELADKKHMVIDLVGAVSIEKYVVGVKQPVVTALTTYNEVCEVVKELKSQGVDNLVINYIGALNGGLNNKMYDGVESESVLGSKKEFENMISYLKEQGVLLFLESNPVDLYNDGNGYNANRDAVKTFYDKYAFQYLYELDTGKFVKDSRWHLLRPALVAELAGKYASTFSKWNVENVSFDRLGDTVYSDYAEGANYITRKDVLGLWAKALDSADQSTNYVMVHSGNQYCAPYVDAVTDVPDTHSNFEIEDNSIPFYQMVFQTSKLMTSGGINTTVDYEQAFLKALETGSSLKYNWIYGDVSQLVGTEYNTVVSYSYDYWKDIAAKQYAEMQNAVGQLAGKEITGHTYLADKVTMTEYGSTAVIVNYGTEAFTYEGNEIGARDYLILSGGAK